MSWGGSTSGSKGWSGGSSSAIYTPTHSKKAPSGGGGVLGFTRNLVSDVGHTVAGLPMGIVETIRHPVATGKAFGEAEWQSWSPLMKGDFGTFKHRFMEHPLAPLLDIATIVTLGAGAGARAGLLASEAGELALASSAGERIVTRAAGRANPVVAARQAMTHRALNRVIGEDKRFQAAARARNLRDEHQINFSIYKMHYAANKAFGRKDTAHLAELQRDLFDHIHGNLSAVAEEGVIGDAAKKRGMVYLAAHPGPGRHPGAGTWGMKRWAQELDRGKLKQKFYTQDASLAAKGPSGQPLMIHKGVLDDYTAEASNSMTFLHKMHHYPLTVWRHLILGTPRYFTNNAVGNAAMFLVNSPSSMRYYVEAVRHIHGENMAKRVIGATPGKGVKWLDQYFGDFRTVPGYRVGHSAAGELTHTTRGGVIGSAEKYGKKWFEVVNRITDEPFRAAMVIKQVRSDPAIQKLIKQGVPEHDAVATRIAHDPAFKHQVITNVEKVFGNYYNLTKRERTLRQFVPFYAWDKAITRSTKNTVLDRPGRTLALAYAGDRGYKHTKAILGDLPRFLQGAVPGPYEKMLPGISKDKGRTNVLTTNALNPYATVSELVQGGASLAGLGGRPGEALGQNFGPFAQSGFEILSGTDLLSGRPLRKNPAGVIAENFGVAPDRPGLPQLRIMAEALHPQKSTYTKRGQRYEKLYDPSVVREWYQVFGLPVKSLSTRTAHDRAKAEQKGGTF